jgi:hypothetical protein
MTNVLAKRRRILADLFPWSEPNYGIDERWARIYPYGQKASPGQTMDVTVKILNHSGSPEVFTAKVNVPKGFGLEPEKISRSIEPRKESDMRFRVTVPRNASKSVQVITCDLEFEGWDLRHWCESLLEILP